MFGSYTMEKNHPIKLGMNTALMYPAKTVYIFHLFLLMAGYLMEICAGKYL